MLMQGPHTAPESILISNRAQCLHQSKTHRINPGLFGYIIVPNIISRDEADNILIDSPQIIIDRFQNYISLAIGQAVETVDCYHGMAVNKWTDFLKIDTDPFPRASIKYHPSSSLTRATSFS